MVSSPHDLCRMQAANTCGDWALPEVPHKEEDFFLGGGERRGVARGQMRAEGDNVETSGNPHLLPSTKPAHCSKEPDTLY